MSRWKIILAGLFLLAPLIFPAVVGMYQLWATGWFFYTFWLILAISTVGWVLLARSMKRFHAESLTVAPADHWGEADAAAWKVVLAEAARSDGLDATKLGDPKFYYNRLEDLTRKVAVFYQKDEREPLGLMTIPEILTLAELASRDIQEAVRRYVPGAHLMRVNDWLSVQKLWDNYSTTRKVSWVSTVLFNPLQGVARYIGSEIFGAAFSKKFQKNLLAWFFSLIIQNVGHYLIELYSRRLRVGADRYRLLLQDRPTSLPPQIEAPEEVDLDDEPDTLDPKTVPPPPDAEPLEPEPERPVTVAVVGSKESGKSGLIESLRGQLVGAGEGNEIEGRWGRGGPLIKLIELRGYNPEYQVETAPKRKGLWGRIRGLANDVYESVIDPLGDGAIEGRLDEIDLMILVTRADRPSLEADREVVKRIQEKFDGEGGLKPPPILVVVTHMDAVAGAMADQLKDARPDGVLRPIETVLGPASVAVVPVGRGGDSQLESASLIAALEKLWKSAAGVRAAREFRKANTESHYMEVVGQLGRAVREVIRGGRAGTGPK